MADRDFLWGNARYTSGANDQAPGPGVNEPSIFSGGDGLILFEGEPIARRVEGSVEVALDWDEVYFQGQYTVGALVLKSIKITGGIKQATADLNMVRRWMGMYGSDYGDKANDLEQLDSVRQVRYIPPVDIIFVLDKSMIPESVASYEAVLVYNAQMNSFSLPVSAASTVFNDQKFTGMNLAFKSYNSGADAAIKLQAGSGGKFIGQANAYKNITPEASRAGGVRNTLW